LQEEEMKRLTRRGFLAKGSIGLAFMGALASLPGLSTALKASASAPKGARSGATAGPLVAHVRDLNSGEIAFLVGSQRFVVRDPELASRLHSAARPQ
jgi:hypothetical protein